MGVKFDSARQPEERVPRGKGKKTLMLDAIREVCGTEEEFLKSVVKVGLGGWSKPDNEEVDPIYQAPNHTLLALILNKVEPPIKSISPLFEFEFQKDSPPHIQASYVLDAISSGIVPCDIGSTFIQSIKSMIDIEEYTILKDRISKIEESLGIVSE